MKVFFEVSETSPDFYKEKSWGVHQACAAKVGHWSDGTDANEHLHGEENRISGSWWRERAIPSQLLFWLKVSTELYQSEWFRNPKSLILCFNSVTLFLWSPGALNWWAERMCEQTCPCLRHSTPQHKTSICELVAYEVKHHQEMPGHLILKMPKWSKIHTSLIQRWCTRSTLLAWQPLLSHSPTFMFELKFQLNSHEDSICDDDLRSWKISSGRSYSTWSQWVWHIMTHLFPVPKPHPGQSDKNGLFLMFFMFFSSFSAPPKL